MAQSKGRSFLLQIGDGLTSEGFTTIAGFRSNEWTVNNEVVDVSDKSSRFRQILEAAGIQSVTTTGSGMFTDSSNEELLRSQAFADTLNNYRLVDMDTGDYIEGAFKASSYQRTGEYNGAVQFSVTLESSGEVTFTAA